jgi:tetratricopeptide (TPR) repeat protein
MKKRSFAIAAASVGIAVAFVVAGSVGVTRGHGETPTKALRDGARSGDVAIAPGASLDGLIASLQSRLKALPSDHVSWATLGLAYVQQAKVAVDPTLYPRADAALAESLKLNADTNYLAYAGLSALASARHDFASAERFAAQGLSINNSSAILHGALSDAQLQLGKYDAAIASVQRMVDLSPDTASLARASYTWELRGNLDEARRLMQRALDDASTSSNRAFALVHLGELAAEHGDANTALTLHRAALAASPDDVSALAGRAKAEAALGQIETALDDYATLVARAPEPSYVIEYARLLEASGRPDLAADQYKVAAATQRLFAANGVEPDVAETLLEADRGDAAKAVANANRGVATRPFLAMYDAQAWALHSAGRFAEARVAIDKARSLGTRNALFEFHAGMIAKAIGDTGGARTALAAALTINPFFDPLYAKQAQATLASIGGGS